MKTPRSLLDLFRRHRKSVFIAVFVAVGFVTINFGSALAFTQKIVNDGVRIETDRPVYAVGEMVTIRLFLVNKLDSPISKCVGRQEIQISSIVGPVYRVTINSLLADVCEKSLDPGSEVLRGIEYWPQTYGRVQVAPGTYTIEASMVNYPSTEVDFRGSATILIVALRFP